MHLPPRLSPRGSTPGILIFYIFFYIKHRTEPETHATKLYATKVLKGSLIASPFRKSKFCISSLMNPKGSLANSVAGSGLGVTTTHFPPPLVRTGSWLLGVLRLSHATTSAPAVTIASTLLSLLAALHSGASRSNVPPRSNA